MNGWIEDEWTLYDHKTIKIYRVYEFPGCTFWEMLKLFKKVRKKLFEGIYGMLS